MRNACIHGLLIFQLVFIVTLNFFMAGCGEDEDDVDTLYEELVGTYELFRAELTFSDGSEIVLEPPNITGSMTISSDRRLTQKVKVYDTLVDVGGPFEIFPDEGFIEIDNETIDFVSKPAYTWDGSVFTTTLDTGTIIETDFWRKL